MKLAALIVFAILFFIVGTGTETAKFFANDTAAAISSPKTTTHPSSDLKPLTEPLTAPVMSAPEVKPQHTDTNVGISTPVIPLDNETVTWNRFISEGFSREQTAGIMGNLQQEHGFRTDGDGLAQWTGARKATLLAMPDNQNITVQLDYLMQELNGKYSLVKKEILASGLDNSVLAFQNKYEVCGICRQDNRLSYAYEILGRH